MYSQSSMDHLIRDLIVRWQRTVILVVLTVVGLIIWVSFFIHGNFEESSRNAASSEVTESISKSSLNTVNLFPQKHFLNESSSSVSTGQDHFDKRQQADPLARSIEVSAVHSNDFHNRSLPLSIPVSSSGEDNDAPSVMEHVSPSFKSTSELRLTETFADKKSRRAVINGKQCVDGTRIRIGTKTYRLTNIRRNSVELIRNDKIIVLRLHE